MQARMRHPNIAAVTDVVDIDGIPRLIMEFVRGSSLDVLLFNESLTMEQVDHLAEGIMKGVAAAHEAGTIHRDLKPANILLEVVDGVLTPKVTDFGLAKALDGYTETAAGVMMGTPQYMAPEQIEDASTVDYRADVFSLGAMLYEMVSGERPFDGATVPQVLQKVLDNERKPISEVAPHIPMNRQRAIESALHPDREQRPDVKTLLAWWVGKTPAKVTGGFSSSVIQRALDRGVGVSLASKAPAPAPKGGAEPTFAGIDVPAALPETQYSPAVSPMRGLLFGGGALALLGAGAVAIAGTGVVAFLLGRGTVDVVAPPPPVVVAPTPAPVVPVPAPVSPAPAPVAPAPASPAPTPPVAAPAPLVPSPAPPAPVSPAPPRPSPKPAPEPVRSYVRAQGDAIHVELVGANGTFDMGPVPPGEYDVWATFAEGGRLKMSVALELGADEQRVVDCNALSLTCKLR